jgi:hypothetical protein
MIPEISSSSISDGTEQRIFFLEESYERNVGSKGTVFCGKLCCEWFLVRTAVDKNEDPPQ